MLDRYRIMFKQKNVKLPDRYYWFDGDLMHDEYGSIPMDLAIPFCFRLALERLGRIEIRPPDPPMSTEGTVVAHFQRTLWEVGVKGKWYGEDSIDAVVCAALEAL